ncbi:MAG: hypothetical protein Q4D62_07515 [Planctomycetia bacterium]|nr:hypothetical protein [Planctomycetia bacterium]
MSEKDLIRITVNCPKELRERVRIRAEKEGRTMTDVVMEALNNYADGGDLKRIYEKLERRITELENKK